MKREKKIRGINSDTQKWVIGYGVIDCEDISQIIHKQGINIMQHTNVLPETVGEFTGLTDKNGVDIYEGDICKTNGLNNWPVFFNNGCFYLKSPNCNYRVGGWDKRWIEVIGNIHQNPELLCPLKP